MGRLYNQMATQQEVTVPSDSPSKTGTIMRMTAYIQSLDQNKESIVSAQSFLDIALDTLDASSDTLIRAKELASRAINGTLSGNERKAIGNEINELLESLVQDANQGFDGRYLFSGTKTDSAPFAATRNADGEIETITYEGSSDSMVFPIGRGRVLSAGITGQAAFVDSGVFDSLISLRDHLKDADGLSEEELQTALAEDFESLSSGQTSFLTVTGQVGTRAGELDSMIQQTDNSITRAREAISRVRDADVARIALDLSREQIVFQALLTSGAKIMSANLMDYV